MQEQLDRIISVSKHANITIQVLPYEVGAHPALESDFIILAFEGDTQSIVYVEGLVGQVYLDRPPDLERYHKVFERLCTMASSPKDSISLLTKIRDTYTND
jgi:hypothetical protein